MARAASTKRSLSTARSSTRAFSCSSSSQPDVRRPRSLTLQLTNLPPHSDETTIVTTDPSDFAPVAHLKIQRASLVPKPDHRIPSNKELLELLGGEPDLLDDEAESVRGSAADSWRISSPSDERNAKEESNASPGPVENSGETSFARRGGWVAVGGVTAFNGKDKRQAKAGPFKDIEDEVVACFQNLRGALRAFWRDQAAHFG